MPPPPHDSKILYYLNDRDEGRYYYCRILALRSAPPPLTPQYLTIYSDSERWAPLSFVGFWRPPPPPPDATILNYLNDRERGALLFFVGFWCPPMTPPPPDATILYYLNDRKRGGAIIIL